MQVLESGLAELLGVDTSKVTVENGIITGLDLSGLGCERIVRILNRIKPPEVFEGYLVSLNCESETSIYEQLKNLRILDLRNNRIKN